MNYYLVSEEELEELKEAAFYEASLVFLNDEPTDRLDRARLACRARPVESAVQPSRMTVLEERVDNLVAHHKHTESFAADIWQRLSHVEDGLSKRIEAMERNSVKTDDWAVRVNGDLHAMHNRLLELEKRSKRGR